MFLEVEFKLLYNELEGGVIEVLLSSHTLHTLCVCSVCELNQNHSKKNQAEKMLQGFFFLFFSLTEGEFYQKGNKLFCFCF